MNSKFAISLSILLFSISSSALGQSAVSSDFSAQAQEPLIVNREEILARNGTVESTSLLLFQNLQDVGTIVTQNISRPGVKSLRLHFVALSPTGNSTWTVNVLNSQKRIVWSYTSAAGDDPDLWSDEIPGDFATVRLSSGDSNSSIRILIDKIALTTPVSTPQGIIGDKDLWKIDEIADPQLRQQVKAWGKPVARLRFIGDDGKKYVCTGFLVSPDLLLTNNHCIGSKSEMKSALADFDYNLEDDAWTSLRFKELLITNRQLDFSLLKLTTPFSDRTPMTLEPADIKDGRPLLIIQHPGGDVKHVSIKDCIVRGENVRGTIDPTDFGHECDTLGGTSGAPIQDPLTGKVIGLHHFGYKKGSRRPLNQAVDIRDILKVLNPVLSSQASSK